MAAKWITLNGENYAVNGDIDRFLLPPLAPAFRTTGLQRRDSLVEGSSFVFPPPVYGFGRRRITDIEDPRQIGSFWRSQLETRFASQITLPLLAEDSTHEEASFTMVPRASASFKGDLWVVWSAGRGDVWAAKYTGSSSS